MLLFKRIVLAEHERALVMKDRKLVQILEPGVHRVFGTAARVQVEVYDLGTLVFDHPQRELLMHNNPELCEKHFQVVALSEQEVGLVYQDGQLIDVLAPNVRTVYWKGGLEIRVATIDISAVYRIEDKLLRQLLYTASGHVLHRAATTSVYAAEVADNHIGLLLTDGKVVHQLPAGLHAFWKFGRNIKVEYVDLRIQAIEVGGQDVLSKDKVSLRINLTANYRVRDALKARNELGDFNGHLYRALQFGLRQAVGERSLDALLGNKGVLDQSVFDFVKAQAEPYGLYVESVGVKDVILPGEMKQMLNRVVEAEKVAQANIIKRREETAATRSLLNTARLMDESPTLLRLKELETLEKVTDKVGSLNVYNGLEGMMSEMVRIQR